ncbi:Isotrichodermin C-15 hydroxylase, partial [Talaromyces pinophilus]
IIAYRLFFIIYNVFFHPLRSIPGPKWFAATGLPYAYHVIRGDWVFTLQTMHEKYGDVVRYAPDDVSFITVSAWKSIYGHAKPGHSNFQKDRRIYRGTLTSASNILIANDNDHSRMRRLLSHAFSEKALRSQEDTVEHYIGKLIAKLKGLAESGPEGEVVDMVRWYNFVTFDLIGDLAFGEPFGCLDSGGYHPWVAMIFQGFKLAALTQVLRRYPSAGLLLKPFLPTKLLRDQRQHQLLSFEKARKRAELGSTEKPDFMSYILRHNDENGMTLDEIGENSNVIIVAGSETTATLLSGTTFWLLKNPKVYRKLVDEIRSSFTTEEDINFTNVSQLRYLLAVLKEGLRMYPPVPSNLPRKVPKGGAIVNQHWISEGYKTSVSVSHWSAYHSAQNFLLPNSFIPERWLDDQRFVDDKQDILQPFSYGPRNCLGKNLAYTEMRLVLARMLWNFDLELQEDSSTWNQQNVYLFWEKPELNVKIIPRQR